MYAASHRVMRRAFESGAANTAAGAYITTQDEDASKPQLHVANSRLTVVYIRPSAPSVVEWCPTVRCPLVLACGLLAASSLVHLGIEEGFAASPCVGKLALQIGAHREHSPYTTRHDQGTSGTVP